MSCFRRFPYHFPNFVQGIGMRTANFNYTKCIIIFLQISVEISRTTMGWDSSMGQFSKKKIITWTYYKILNSKQEFTFSYFLIGYQNITLQKKHVNIYEPLDNFKIYPSKKQCFI